MSHNIFLLCYRFLYKKKKYVCVTKSFHGVSTRLGQTWNRGALLLQVYKLIVNHFVTSFRIRHRLRSLKSSTMLMFKVGKLADRKVLGK
jgi:hypothetical protein